jgi:hypothetical protein
MKGPLTALKVFLCVFVIRFLLSLLAEKLLLIAVPTRDMLMFSGFVGLVATPIAAVSAWSYARRAGLTLGLLFGINAILIGFAISRSPSRFEALTGYLIWAVVDLSSVLFAWAVVRNIDGPSRDVTPSST